MDYKQREYEAKHISSIAEMKESEENKDNRLGDILDRLQEHLDENHKSLVDKTLAGKIGKEEIKTVISEWIQDEREAKGFVKENLVKDLVDMIVGWGKVQPIIDDTEVQDIFLNDNGKVIKHTKDGYVVTNISFSDDDEATNFIKAIMMKTGQKINHNICLQDAMDHVENVRINAGISGSPIRKEVVRAPYFALRLYRVPDYKKEFFIENETFNEAIYQTYVKHLLKSVVVIVGAPGSGKTTQLDFLQKEKLRLNPMRRTIRIEEIVELTFEGENVVSFFARENTSEMDARKSYTMVDFTKQCTRLSGEDVVIGEVRGGEAFYLMRLLNMGYSGMITLHGDSLEQAIFQLGFLMSLESGAPLELMYKMAADMVDYVIFMSHKKVVDVGECLGWDPIEKAPKFNRIHELELNDGRLEWINRPVTDERLKKQDLFSMLEKRRV